MEQQIIDCISLLSYNPTGWNSFKTDFIKNQLNPNDTYIIAIQEHFMLKQNLFKIQAAFSDYDVFAVPAVKNNSQIMSGRPSGGLAFLYNSNLGKFVTRISCPNSSRVQGLKLDLQNESFVFINAYFPVDKRNCEIDDLICVLQDVTYILNRCDNDSKVILLGDLNCDFSRDTFFVNHVKQFIFENNLQHIWSKFSCDFSYSHTRNMNGVESTSLSVIDHFCVSQNLINDCFEAFPIHSPDNLSNHVPIYMKFNCILNGTVDSNQPDISNLNSSRPIWNRATEIELENYKLDLENLVSTLHVPVEAINCTDVHCGNEQHRIDVDIYAANLMECISIAVEENIPHSKVSASGDKFVPVPGWTDYVKPFREDSLFWHSVWVSAGRPINTVLHNVMKNTRNKYHYAIRFVKKQESEIRKNKLLQECLGGRVNDILKQIKSSRKNKSACSKNIDGVSGVKNIASHFNDIYKGIYNQHNSTEKVGEIMADVNAKITARDLCELHKISPILLKDVISKLHNGKTDNVQNWGTDALKTASDILAEHFSKLFKSYLVHGYISDIFLTSSLIPIVKNANESKVVSDNYRLIAISSLMLKVFDYVLLTLFSDTFKIINLQFGYQKNCSTSMCTWTLLETINYFTSRGTSMFICLLDLSKAFDTIKHDILFKKLSDKIPPLFLRVIIFSYLNQTCAVRWGNTLSDNFSVSNGVRQGAVASPIFFNVYIDDLFKLLRNSGLGCMIDNFYYGLLGYADDCALLSPSRDILQRMVNICSQYFKQHGIKISTNIILEKSKTKCMAINIPTDPGDIIQDIILYDTPLPWVDSYKHLGFRLYCDQDTSHDILQKRGEFISNVHALGQELGSQHPFVTVSLVSIYFSSFYGSNLWDLYSEAANRVYASWNVFIRKTFDLPFATHRYILNELSNKPHIRTSLLKRFVKFHNQLKCCQKTEVRHLFQKQKSDYRSIFGRNCLNLCNEMNVSSVEEIDIASIKIPQVTLENDCWRLDFLKELLGIRDNYLNTELSPAETAEIIDLVCCT